MRKNALDKCCNIADLRRLARRKVPKPIFHWLDGGAEDEYTLGRNTSAFDNYELLPDTCVDVAALDTRSNLLGTQLSWPVFLSPTGTSRFLHHAGELAVARAAAKSGTFYSLSTLSSFSLEDVAEASKGPKIFQLYIFRTRELTASLVARCRAAGYVALALTVDMPVGGNRERDLKTGLVFPPKPSLRSFAGFAACPRWTFNTITKVKFGFPSFDTEMKVEQGPRRDSMHFVNTQFDRSVQWKDVEWLARLWNGPLIIKGILSPRDAKTALDCGATAVMVSNHGGRQLDGVPAPIDCIADIRSEVGQKLEIILDGGVRRGTHVLKAIARGANACSIGRSYLYGLAAGGEAGVDRALGILKAEVERDLALCGVASLQALQSRHVRVRVGT